jgi:hypothetical protein
VSLTPALLTLLVALLAPAAAWAQADFSGSWQPLYHEDGPERIPGPEIGDYLGLPLNDAARLRADSYDADRISIATEYQCRPHGADYSMRGLANLRIRTEIDPLTQQVIAFHTRMGAVNMARAIYLDGRPHPPAHAAHTWSGFSTGVWQGNMLTIRTTHLKPSYMRRNGLAASSRRTFTEHWVRHGDFLTVVTIIDDPVFLTERLVRSQSWYLDPGQQLAPDTCQYAPELPAPEGTVRHYLPGQNPYLREFSELYGIPFAATRGGAETMYPEYRRVLKQTFSTLDRCQRYCTCMNLGAACALR